MAQAGFPKQIQYGVLKTRNDQYMGDFWKQCKALYAGGPTLLNDRDLLKKCMPAHRNELDDVYKERLDRAFYIPYAGAIVDKLIAELMSKPVTFELEETTQSAEDGGQTGSDEVKGQSLPDYYSDLVKSCGKPGGKRVSLNQFAREQILSALQCQTSWALVDMPKAPVEGYANREAQDKAGALNAYICTIDPECVIDWEEKEDGELKWVIVQDVIVKREGIEDNRNTVILRWRYYREDDWAIYEIQYDKKAKPQGPADTDLVELVDQGKHSFGRVPVRRLELTEGLWAMGKLEAMARAHLNQRNALSWGQFKALFPVPVLFAMTPDPNNPVSEDMGRITQQHGQGFLRVMAEKDRLEYFAPDSAPYQIAGEDLNVIRDEMHRVLYAMAQSIDNSGAALQRSGESKAIDQAAAAVILKALGTYVREHLEDLLLTIATGRKDNHRFSAKGMDNFDDTTLSQLVVDAVGISALAIKSAKFKSLFDFRVAKLALGSDATEDDLEEVKEQIESSTTQDEFEAEIESKMAGHEADVATAKATVKDPFGVKAKAAGKPGKPKPKKAKK